MDLADVPSAFGLRRLLTHQGYGGTDVAKHGAFGAILVARLKGVDDFDVLSDGFVRRAQEALCKRQAHNALESFELPRKEAVLEQ